VVVNSASGQIADLEVVGSMPVPLDLPTPRPLPELPPVEVLATEDSSNTAVVVAAVLGGFLAMAIVAVIGMRSRAVVMDRRSAKKKAVEEAYKAQETYPRPGDEPEPGMEPASAADLARDIAIDMSEGIEEPESVQPTSPAAEWREEWPTPPQSPRAAAHAKRKQKISPSSRPDRDGWDWYPDRDFQIPDELDPDMMPEQPVNTVGTLIDLFRIDTGLSGVPELPYLPDPRAKSPENAMYPLTLRGVGAADGTPTSKPEELASSAGNLRGLLSNGASAPAAPAVSTVSQLRTSHGALRELLAASKPSDLEDIRPAFGWTPPTSPSPLRDMPNSILPRRARETEPVSELYEDPGMPRWDMGDDTDEPGGNMEPDELALQMHGLARSPSPQEVPMSPHSAPFSLQSWLDVKEDIGQPLMPEHVKNSAGSLHDLLLTTVAVPAQATVPGLEQPMQSLPTLQDHLKAGDALALAAWEAPRSPIMTDPWPASPTTASPAPWIEASPILPVPGYGGALQMLQEEPYWDEPEEISDDRPRAITFSEAVHSRTAPDFFSLPTDDSNWKRTLLDPDPTETNGVSYTDALWQVPEDEVLRDTPFSSVVSNPAQHTRGGTLSTGNIFSLSTSNACQKRRALALPPMDPEMLLRSQTSFRVQASSSSALPAPQVTASVHSNLFSNSMLSMRTAFRDMPMASPSFLVASSGQPPGQPPGQEVAELALADCQQEASKPPSLYDVRPSPMMSFKFNSEPPLAMPSVRELQLPPPSISDVIQPASSRSLLGIPKPVPLLHSTGSDNASLSGRAEIGRYSPKSHDCQVLHLRDSEASEPEAKRSRSREAVPPLATPLDLVVLSLDSEDPPDCSGSTQNLAQELQNHDRPTLREVPPIPFEPAPLRDQESRMESSNREIVDL
jgi:hypothetical protein